MARAQLTGAGKCGKHGKQRSAGIDARCLMEPRRIGERASQLRPRLQQMSRHPLCADAECAMRKLPQGHRLAFRTRQRRKKIIARSGVHASGQRRALCILPSRSQGSAGTGASGFAAMHPVPCRSQIAACRHRVAGDCRLRPRSSAVQTEHAGARQDRRRSAGAHCTG